jgi:hypothetical protein
MNGISNSEYCRRYRETHKEELKEKRKLKNAKPEVKLAKSVYYKQYATTHYIELREYQQQYRKKHPRDCWKQMLYRCYNPKNREYTYYGARGIKVCDAWLDFRNFEPWAIQNGWQKGLTIDRTDNDGNYEPSNCRFITRAENIAERNRRLGGQKNSRRDTNGKYCTKNS